MSKTFVPNGNQNILRPFPGWNHESDPKMESKPTVGWTPPRDDADDMGGVQPEPSHQAERFIVDL